MDPALFKMHACIFDRMIRHIHESNKGKFLLNIPVLNIFANIMCPSNNP